MKRSSDSISNNQEDINYANNPTGATNILLGTHGKITARVSQESLRDRWQSHAGRSEIVKRKIDHIITLEEARLLSAENLRSEIEKAKVRELDGGIISEWQCILGKKEGADFQEILTSAEISCGKYEYQEAKREYERVIALKVDGEEMMDDKWYACMELYKLYFEMEEKVQCLEGFLKLPEAKKEHRYYARKILCALYLELGDVDKAIKYYVKIVKMENLEGIEDDLGYLIESFMEHPGINLNDQLRRIYEKEETIQDKLLEILMNNPGLIYGQYKLREDQWNAILEGDVGEDEIFDHVFSQYVSIQDDGYSVGAIFEEKIYLNEGLFLKNDYILEQSSILKQRENECAGILDEGIARFETIFGRFCSHKRAEDRLYLKNFVERCIQGREGDDKERTAKRIIAIIDLLEEYALLEGKETRIEVIHGAMDIIIEGGKGCGDLASIALNNVENYLKVVTSGPHRGEVFLHMFKLYCIQDKLTKKGYDENLETQLYYEMQFSEILGLGLNDLTMLHSGFAKALPLEEALTLLCPAFTAENLIKFTIGHYVFGMVFEKDEAVKAKIELLELEYDDLNDPEVEGVVRRTGEEILEEKEKVTDAFYVQKAVQMYREGGLLGYKAS